MTHCPLPTHHPSQECLLSYANGCMGEAESLLLATHLAFCPDCRKLTRIGECVGSTLMQDTPAVSVSTACRDKLFAALDTADCTANPTPARTASSECFIPEPLRGYLGGMGCKTSVQQLAWETISPGHREFKLSLTSCCARRGADARMIALAAQTPLTLPAAAHRRALLVLCGQLEIEGTSYHAGDILCATRPDNPLQGMTGAESCITLLVTTQLSKSWLGKFLRLIKCT